MLVRCLYASRAAAPLAGAAIDAIVEQSRRNNPQRGITGMLCFADDIFIQVLEGGREEVCRLFNTLVADQRHKEVTLLLFEEIAERRFGSWTMGQVDFARANQGLLLKYYEKAAVNPFASSGHVTLALMDEMVRTGAITSRMK